MSEAVNPKYLECWKLNKTFPTPAGAFVAVDGFDLNLAQGEFSRVVALLRRTFAATFSRKRAFEEMERIEREFLAAANA